jgi:two-component system response regulator FixJ
MDETLIHVYRISPRENEVIDLLCKGLSFEKIGNALSLSPRTIETHVEKAKKKLGVDNLFQMGLRIGMVRRANW